MQRDVSLDEAAHDTNDDDDEAAHDTNDDGGEAAHDTNDDDDEAVHDINDDPLGLQWMSFNNTQTF